MLPWADLWLSLPGGGTPIREASEGNRWERIFPDLCAGCTVLKLAHHGSHDGTDARWLELVNPELAVASVR
jgi:beta-lactamase superfamily II metal-dependent hydrolase